MVSWLGFRVFPGADLTDGRERFNAGDVYLEVVNAPFLQKFSKGREIRRLGENGSEIFASETFPFFFSKIHFIYRHQNKLTNLHAWMQ